jgi:hypothetical protein
LFHADGAPRVVHSGLPRPTAAGTARSSRPLPDGRGSHSAPVLPAPTHARTHTRTRAAHSSLVVATTTLRLQRDLRCLRPDPRRARPGHDCVGTGLTPATSAPGLGSPQPHLRRDSKVLRSGLRSLRPVPRRVHRRRHLVEVSHGSRRRTEASGARPKWDRPLGRVPRTGADGSLRWCSSQVGSPTWLRAEDTGGRSCLPRSSRYGWSEPIPSAVVGGVGPV